MSKAKADQLTKEIKALKDQIKQAKAEKHDVNDGGTFCELSVVRSSSHDTH